MFGERKRERVSFTLSPVSRERLQVLVTRTGKSGSEILDSLIERAERAEGDKVALLSLREVAQEIVEFAGSKTPDDLLKDRILVLALQREFELFQFHHGALTPGTKRLLPSADWLFHVGSVNGALISPEMLVELVKIVSEQVLAEIAAAERSV